MADTGHYRYGSQDSAFHAGEHEERAEHKSVHSTGSGSVEAQDYAHARTAAHTPGNGNDQPRLQSQSQPLKDAVSSAFNQADTTQVPPDLVAHITEQVLYNLKISGLATSVPTAPQPLPMRTSPVMLPTSVPPRNVYTPPTPERYETMSTHSFSSDFNDYQLDGHAEKEQRTAPHIDRPATPPQSRAREQSRPSARPRASTGDATTLEKIWQPLFDTSGQPTPRLGQFLRGLAVHIIDDFEPKQSLVITPQKMLSFYTTTKVLDEIYPWNSIFGGKMSHSSLSHLYRDLKCQHHFVQLHDHHKPSVPALTPVGFEQWMSHVIRAHPEIEYRRFSFAVLNMPISNADNPKERFPKDLSRRLFPSKADAQLHMDLDDAILADPVIELSHITPTNAQPSASAQPPPSPRTSQSSHIPPPPTSQTTHMPPPPPPSTSHLTYPRPPPTSTMERDRTPYSTLPSDGAVEEPSQSSIAIERERKPYSAYAGGGKLYDADDVRSTMSDGAPSRSNSMAAARPPRPTVVEVPDDYDNFRQPRQHRASTSGTQPFRRRQRSHSPNGRSNPYTRSEGDVLPTMYSNAGSSAVLPDSDDELRRLPSREDRPRQRYVINEDGTSKPYSGARVGFEEDRFARRGSVQQNASSGYGGYPPPPPRY